MIKIQLSPKAENALKLWSGCFGWFALGDILLSVCFGVSFRPGLDFILPLGWAGFWLLTLLSIVLLAKKEVWYSIGISIASISSVAIGLLWTTQVLHIYQARAIWLVALAPFPLDLLLAALVLYNPHYIG